MTHADKSAPGAHEEPDLSTGTARAAEDADPVSHEAAADVDDQNGLRENRAADADPQPRATAPTPTRGRTAEPEMSTTAARPRRLAGL